MRLGRIVALRFCMENVRGAKARHLLGLSQHCLDSHIVNEPPRRPGRVSTWYNIHISML